MQVSLIKFWWLKPPPWCVYAFYAFYAGLFTKPETKALAYDSITLQQPDMRQ